MKTFARLFAAALTLGTAHASAADLPTPAGLSPGDTFRFVFVTAGTASASTSNIIGYNMFIDANDGGSTYNGVEIDWFAVASTSSTDAYANLGGYQANQPVYLVNGTQVATDLTTSAGGFWSGTLMTTISVGIDGNSIAESRVWTGTATDGTESPDGGLGDAVARFGLSSYSDSFWVSVNISDNSDAYRLYGMSQPLTAVPEPSGIALGIIATAAIAYLRRNRSAS